MKFILMAGVFALTVQTAQIPAQQTQAPAPQQTIPDAPRPQTGIPAVTPGIGAAASSTSDRPPAANDPDQPAVPSSLQSSPPAITPQSSDVDPVPDLPTNGQGPSAIAGTLVLQTNFVDVPFTVKDSRGQLVPGLTWRDIRVFENGVRQQMKVFTVDPFPLSVALVIDQSLTYDTMNRVNNALGALPAAFTNYDEVAVFTYNNGPKLQTTFTGGQSPRLAAVMERTKATGRDPIYYAPGEALGGPTGIQINGHSNDNINPLVSGGPGSPQGLSSVQVPREVHTLNDAILMAAQSLTHVNRDRRRIIYVISDGKEYGSTAKTKQVIQYLATNRIQVYATLVGDSSVSGLGFVDRFHLPLEMRDNILPVYTRATGGQFYAEYRTNGIEKSFSQIAEQVRTQYTVGYYSHEPFIDGKYRKLEVRVLQPNLTIIAKDGYYPSAQEVRPQAPAPAAPKQ